MSKVVKASPKATKKDAKVPRVSIVTPMYNAEKYIEQAMRSMMAQSYADFEHIVVNDGSTDGCVKIVEKLAKEDDRIKLIHAPKNEGYSRATNRAFAAATGEYFVVMDADDISDVRRIEKEVEYLDANPSVGLVATQYHRLSSEGEVLRPARNKLTPAALRFHLLFGVPVCNPSTALRAKAVKELMPEVYNPKLAAAPDYDFMLRISKKWAMHVLSDYLFYYRVHAGGMSKQKKTILIEEVVSMATPLIRKTIPNLPVTDAEIAEFIGIQGDPRTKMDAAKTATYLKVLSALRKGFNATLLEGERKGVNRFAGEMEIKALLGRYKFYKKPGLLLRWVTNPNSSVWAMLCALI